MNISTLITSINILNHKLLFQCLKSTYIWKFSYFIIKYQNKILWTEIKEWNSKVLINHQKNFTLIFIIKI
jgi:hypothetical protein